MNNKIAREDDGSPPTRKPKAPRKPPTRWKDGIDPTWLRSLAELWHAVWSARHTEKYAWQLEGKDRRVLAQIAEAAGVAKNTPLTGEQRATITAAFERYHNACDAGTAWPPEPPNLGAFAMKCAVWFQAGSTKKRGSFSQGHDDGWAPVARGDVFGRDNDNNEEDYR